MRSSLCSKLFLSLASLGTLAASDADQKLYWALLKAVRRKDHVAWPNVHKDSSLLMPAAEVEESVNLLLRHWRSIPDADAGASLSDEEQCRICSKLQGEGCRDPEGKIR